MTIMCERESEREKERERERKRKREGGEEEKGLDIEDGRSVYEFMVSKR